MLVSSHLLSEAFVVQDSDQNLFDLPAEVENEQLQGVLCLWRCDHLRFVFKLSLVGRL